MRQDRLTHEIEHRRIARVQKNFTPKTLPHFLECGVTQEEKTLKQRFNLFILAVLVLAIVVPLLQAQMNSNQPPRALVGMYQVAPGKHLEFLKWQAANEAINKEAADKILQVNGCKG